MTDRLPESKNLESLFVNHQDIVYYSTPEEAAELAKFYLKNDEARERIALNGYQKVISGHTSLQRANQILSFIQSKLT